MSDEPFVSLHAVVRGRVQGVGFRDFALTRARMLGLNGYVRNLPEGRSVEVVAEGVRPQLERLLEHLHSGPRGAVVEAVDVNWGPGSGRASGFDIHI